MTLMPVGTDSFLSAQGVEAGAGRWISRVGLSIFAGRSSSGTSERLARSPLTRAKDLRRRTRHRTGRRPGVADGGAADEPSRAEARWPAPPGCRRSCLGDPPRGPPALLPSLVSRRNRWCLMRGTASGGKLDVDHRRPGRRLPTRPPLQDLLLVLVTVSMISLGSVASGRDVGGPWVGARGRRALQVEWWCSESGFGRVQSGRSAAPSEPLDDPSLILGGDGVLAGPVSSRG